MLKAMGKMITTRSAHRKGLSKGWTIADAIGAAVRAAREVNEPDYKAMWEETKVRFFGYSWGPYTNPGNIMAEIERRHGGGKA